MAMTLDTAIKFTAKLDGQGLDQLKRGLQGLSQQSNRTSKDLDELYNVNKKLAAASGQSVNSLQRQITVMTNLRNEAQIGSRQFKFYSSELDKLQRQQTQLTNSGSGRGGLFGLLGGLGGGLGSLAAAAGGALAVKYVADVGLQAQSAQVRLKALADQFGEYNQAQESAARIASTLRISTTEAQDAFSKLYAALRPTGVSIKEIEDAYIGFTAAARASGASAEESANALLQLKQALGSGVLQGDELRSLKEQAPAAAQAIAREMGVSVGELKKLGEQGKITSDIVLKALASLKNENLGKLNAQFDTGAQAIKDFQIAVENLGKRLAEVFGPTALRALRAFTGVLERTNELIGGGGGATAIQNRTRAQMQAREVAQKKFGVFGALKNGAAYNQFVENRQAELFAQFQTSGVSPKADRLDANQLAAQTAASREREAARQRARLAAMQDEIKIRQDAEQKLADAAQHNAEQLADYRAETIKRAAQLERSLGDERLQIERSIAESRRRIAEQEQDIAFEAERQRLRAAGLGTDAIDAAQELADISRRYSEQRIQNEQTATDRQVQLQRQLEDFKTSVADGIGKIQEGYARSVSSILQDAGDKLAAKMVNGAQAAAGALSGAAGGALGASTLQRGTVGGGQLKVGTLLGLAKAAGFNDKDARIMAAIAMAESGGRSSAYNGNAATGDKSYGLWQVNMLGAMGPQRRQQFGISNNAQLFDPATNAQAARQVYQSQGFGAWSAYKSGAYLQYLPSAMTAQPVRPGNVAGFNSTGLMGGIQKAGGQLGGAIGTEKSVKDQQAFNQLFADYLGKFGQYKQDLDGVTTSAKQQIDDQQRMYELMRSGLSPELAKQRVDAENIARSETQRLEALRNQIDKELQRTNLTEQQRAQLADLRSQVVARLESEKGITDEALKQQQAYEQLQRQQALLADLTQSIGSTLSQGIIGGIDAAIEAAMTGAKGLEDKLKAIASGVLKDIGSALIRFGLNSLAGGLGFGSFLKFADGGVMTSAGAMPLKRYAGGGVANSPQMAVYGDRGPEAYVPLPDGRSIPVKMQQRNNALDRYRPIGANGTVAADGELGTAGAGAAFSNGAIDVRYNVERINNVEYVTADQFQQGLRQAAREGAARGEQQTLRRLQTSVSTRRKVGV